MTVPFLGYENIIPLVAPYDSTTNTVTSPYMDLRNAQGASFLISFGLITSTTVTDEMVITLEAASVEEGTEVALGYRYRLSAAVGDNTWGAVTSCASTGFGMGADDSDNMCLLVEADPDAIAGHTADFRFARVVITPDPASQMEACLVGVLGLINPRYKQTTHISETAYASS
jgi:hypothetical protein